MCLDQVTADYGTIGFAENRMEMQGRALSADRDIAEQRQDLDLLANGDLLVSLGFPLEIPEDGAAECADCG